MELADNSSLSDFTKKTLMQFGWKEKDPIPADLGALMISFRETLPPSKNFEVLIDIAQLNEAQVGQIKGMLEEAKVAQKELDEKKQHAEQQQKITENMKPELAESMRRLLENMPQIIDDRDGKEPAAKEDAAPEEPAPATPVSESVAQPINGPPFCPRCGWDMKQKFEVEATDADKEEFLIALLGGKRFRKKYALFGGKVVVTFRNMLAEENKAIYRQLVLDQQAKKIATEAEWFVQMMDYRLACSFEELTDKDGKPIASMPEVALVTPLPEDDTNNPLVQQLQKINSTTLAQEVTRRLVGAHLRKFQRLLETLEAQALDPSFWSGIE